MSGYTPPGNAALAVASTVGFAPGGTIAATDVQTAIAEVDADAKAREAAMAAGAVDLAPLNARIDTVDANSQARDTTLTNNLGTLSSTVAGNDTNSQARDTTLTNNLAALSTTVGTNDTNSQARDTTLTNNLAALSTTVGTNTSGLAALTTTVGNNDTAAKAREAAITAQTSVLRFANAAARTSGLPSPATGQMTTLDSRPGYVQAWTGSAWVDMRMSAEGFFNMNPNTTCPPTTTTVANFLTGIVLPFTGSIVLNAFVKAQYMSGTDAATSFTPKVNAATSTPGFSGNGTPQGQYFPDGAPRFGLCCVPVIAFWSSVTAGTSLTVDMALIVGGGPSLLCTGIYGSWRLTPVGLP